MNFLATLYAIIEYDNEKIIKLSKYSLLFDIVDILLIIAGIVLW